MSDKYKIITCVRVVKMSTKRLLTETEKQIVRSQQIGGDGSLRCFISGEIIGSEDEYEYDHIHPYSKDGETSVSNIRIVLKEYNRRKHDQSLYDIRDNIRLERLFESQKNNIRLQDILKLKDIEKRSFHAEHSDCWIRIYDNKTTVQAPLFHDAVLDVYYFYSRIPVRWIENDDQEGLQPRVIDYKRLIAIRDHLKSHPQLAPSIGRLLDGKIRLFDGQHKLASQVLNNQLDVDIKIYLSPNDVNKSKNLFDNLMITNLEAHSKLKQIPFYTSTLLDRLSVIYKEFLEEFVSTTQIEKHTEQDFVRFLSQQKGFSAAEAKEMLRSTIKNVALGISQLGPYVAKASKDVNYPITVDLLDKSLFRSTLYMEPSSARFNTELDFRNSETNNFLEVSKLIVTSTEIENWTSHAKGKTLTNIQLKSRRIWHKGSVLTCDRPPVTGPRQTLVHCGLLGQIGLCR